MAGGWVLAMGVVALVVVIAVPVAIVRLRQVPSRGTARLVTIGPLLVILGIVIGEDRLFGYGFIGAGVLVSLLGAYFARQHGTA
jgi:hypothetical protein